MKFKIQILQTLQRFFLPWTFTRIMFILIGTSVLVQAIFDNLWIGIIFGSYFIATGLFAWGCAGGNCQVPASSSKQTSEVKYEEIKE